MSDSLDKGVCERCNAEGAGGEAGCLRLYEDVLAREYGDQRYFKVHRLTVDAYCLQHPERYMVSGKSFVVHLIRMHIALEANNDAHLNEVLRKWIDNKVTIEKPATLPSKRGGLTITYIHSASTPEEHSVRVCEWAGDVWNSWKEHHALARQLLAAATDHARARETPPA
jgi:hypothetical protein